MVFITGDLLKDFLAIFAALVLIIYVAFKRKYKCWENKGVQYPVPEIPFGNAKGLLLRKTSFGELFTDAYKEYKRKGLKYFGSFFLTNPIFVVIEPELIKTILTTDFQHFTDHGIFVDEEREPLTAHLFALGGLQWRNLRAKLTPTFTSGKMKMMFHTLIDCSKGLIEVIDKTIDGNKPLDIKDVGGRYTADVIGSCAFGLDTNCLKNPDSDFEVYGKKILRPTFSQILARSVANISPKLVRLFNLTIFPKDTSEFFLRVVKETVEYREKNNISRKDFMHLLIQLKNNLKIDDKEHNDEVTNITKDSSSSEVGTYLTFNQLAAQAFVFFVAGFETSSTTFTFCLYELVQNPEIQEKLRDEIDVVLKRHGGEVTYESLMEMSYLSKCISETLRKYPPIPFLFRSCTIPYKVPNSDVMLEKGTRVFIPVLNIQHDPEYYPEPEKFDPERFSAEEKEERHPFTWLPFGEGPRACIGLRFGLMQTKAALVCLLKNYRFSLNSKTIVPLVIDPKATVMSAQGDIWLNAKRL